MSDTLPALQGHAQTASDDFYARYTILHDLINKINPLTTNGNQKMVSHGMCIAHII